MLATRPLHASSVSISGISARVKPPGGPPQELVQPAPFPNPNSTLPAPGASSFLPGTNSISLSYDPWPPLPFQLRVLPEEIGPQFRSSIVLGVYLLFLGWRRECVWEGQNLMAQSAHDYFTRSWPHVLLNTPYHLQNPDFDPVVGMVFQPRPSLVAHPQRALLWSFIQHVVGYLKRFYVIYGCRTTAVGITVKLHDRTTVPLGTFHMDIVEPPTLNPNLHWPALSAFPLRFNIPGENHPGTYLEFLNNNGAHGLWDGELWTDVDPVRKVWVCNMLNTAIQQIQLERPDQHGHIDVDGFMIRARYVGFQADIVQLPHVPDEAQWTKDLVIRIFAFLWHIIRQNGVIEVVIKVYKQGRSDGYITLQRL